MTKFDQASNGAFQRSLPTTTRERTVNIAGSKGTTKREVEGMKLNVAIQDMKLITVF